MTTADTGKAFIEHKVFKAKERQDLADKGQAMPTGGYPIRNTADLRRAIQAYGRAKDKPKTMAWIIKRAKELDAEDLIPESWMEKKAAHTSSFKEFLEHHGVKGMKWGVRRSRRQLARAANERTGKSVKDLSDEELRAVVNRMNMEQQYANLTGGRQRSLASSGLSFAGSIATNIARTQITNAANAQIAKALNRR